ncbi:hypothetical protein [uncultured Flavobacterium sp.]|uniref:hypothetical protein n=1 Tax=uncultured Flavobacterium sp. TaxID=165435 RepID=UPI0030EB86DF|tara:strand:+ start:55288 stop:55917 length:630 start_codon:yes stop_codon:yes gene_type:complete
MKRFVFIYLLIFISCSSITQGTSNLDIKKGRKEYKNYVRQIKKPNYPINMDSLDFPVEKLYKLTKVKSNYTEQFVSFPSPSKENIEDWENWYKLNKNNIYFDSKYKVIKVTENVKYIRKAPKKLYLTYVSIIRKMFDNQHYYVEEFDYINQKLHRLTDVSILDDELYSEENESFSYQEITFTKWKNWFELNKEKLVWDIENQEIKIKKN